MKRGLALTTLALATGLLAPAASAQQNSFDAQFLRKAVADSILEIQLGMLAQTNSRNPAVQQFGEQLVADHTAALAEIQQVVDRLWVLVPESLPPSHERVLNRLSGLTGPRFDREFIKENLRTHSRGISLAQSAARRARSPLVRTLARSQLPVLIEHLLMTLQLQDDVGDARRS